MEFNELDVLSESEDEEKSDLVTILEPQTELPEGK